jgi:hypothetical protein
MLAIANDAAISNMVARFCLSSKKQIDKNQIHLLIKLKGGCW